MNIHTKGPWKILPRNRNLANGRGPGYDVQKDDPDGLGEIICDKATLADAQLIAAAPDLVDACQKALAFVLDGQLIAHRSFGKLLNRFEAAEMIRRAIAKAERGTV